MQRIFNDPNLVVEDAVKGYVKANPSILSNTNNPRVLKFAGNYPQPKVGVVTGGGSGHEPAFLGYVGRNLIDAVAIGEIFSSPSASTFADAFRAANQGKGVACLYGNYAGDNMNVKMAIKTVAKEGIVVKTVVANDDVASSPASEREKRRGVAGEILMWKVGGAAAAAGYELDEVIKVAQKAIDNCRSVGVGLSACVIPAVGKPNFHIEPGKMEFGIGHHGEPGTKITAIEPADKMAKTMLEPILADLPFGKGDEVVVLVSGLGATPDMELNILYSRVADLMAEAGIKIHHCYVGNYFTSLEMFGVTLTVMKLDDELKKFVDAPAFSVGLKQI